MLKHPKLLEQLKEMKRQHEKHSVDFNNLKSKLAEKKRAFLENLKHMKSKLKGHSKVFDSVQRLTDKLPELFDHFKNLVNNLANKNKKDVEEKSEKSSESSDSDEEIVQHDETVEEEAFGAKPDSDEDDDSEDFEDEETEEKIEKPVQDDEGQESRGETLDKDHISETAENLDNKLEEVNQPNFVNLDDGILDQLEQEQKGFEVRQNDQNEHINGLKYIDDGLVRNGKDRRMFGDRFVKYLGSDDMKNAPQDVKEHLEEMNRLFNAREN